MKKLLLVPFVLIFCLSIAKSEDDTTAVNVDSLMTTVLNADSLGLQILNYDTAGTIQLHEGLATFNIPAGFKYLNPTQSAYVLADLWGNPPSETSGMIFPSDASPIFPGVWAIEISYEEEGHVKDGDAKDIDYKDLLDEMQDQVKDANEHRKEQGYASVELLGWASDPYYDQTAKKLHWAKRLQFEGDSSETLNYNIRILGREGVLVLNAIGDMNQLDEIKQNIDVILASTNFSQGHRYEDFNESTDKLAAYGIGGLIAGGLLAKTGFFAKIGLIFAKFAKVIVIGAVALGGVAYRFFKGKSA